MGQFLGKTTHELHPNALRRQQGFVVQTMSEYLQARVDMAREAYLHSCTAEAGLRMKREVAYWQDRLKTWLEIPAKKRRWANHALVLELEKEVAEEVFSMEGEA